MIELNNNQRNYLRKLAHDLKPVVQVGKNGLNAAVLAAVEQALENHELIKVKFVEHKEERRELTEQLVNETNSGLVLLVGNVAILYRQSSDDDKRTIILPN
ncbi:MAG: ribosome assembly RNA-binding protein YhbY [Herpetosiphon sp.]|nr:ribosome assembly RNA-binding protein YhbY [Herpetosiphon sp.]